MTDQAIQKGPVIVVFGVTGDLSRRKLLPALYHLLRQKILPEDTKIVGVSRRPLSTDQLLATVELCVLEKDGVCEPEGILKVKNAIETVQIDPTEQSDFKKLHELLTGMNHGGTRDRLFYMSVPTAAYKAIIHNLAASGLNDEHSRLLVEKPFGHDTESARELLDLTAESFQEHQVYRIDHYLAKETAQNIITFRMHNPIFAPLWSNEHIKSVHIRAHEKLSIEGRSAFYEQTGALRDLIQSHLMQLLAITLMDLPADMSAQSIHTSKQYFLNQVLPADPREAERAQYEGYRDEVENPESTVETYARIKVAHSSDRWRGTEITLETGKGLPEKTTDITIEFKQPHDPRRNNLIFHIQPNEGITLELMVKEPGFENHMRRAGMSYRYADNFQDPQIDAYERVLMDAIRGDQSLFASDQEVLATWHILQPLLDAWHDSGHGLRFYPQGGLPE